MNSTSDSHIRSMVQNPTFILARGIQRIRMIHRASFKTPSKIKIKSCEYYLKDRNIRKKTLLPSQIALGKSAVDLPSFESTLPLDSPEHLSDPPDLRVPSGLLKAESRSSQLLAPYIEKFLSKKSIIKKTNQNLSEFPPVSFNSVIIDKMKEIVSEKRRSMLRSHSENIFIKLQNSISNELEKSVSTQKLFKKQLDSIKSLKKITDGFGRFKPTKFELGVLGVNRKNFEIHEIQKFKALNLTSKYKMGNTSGSKFVPNSNSMVKYQNLFRQFNSN